MAKVCIVPKEDWAVIKKYVEDGTVLVPENVLSKILPERAEQLRALDGQICQSRVVQQLLQRKPPRTGQASTLGWPWILCSRRTSQLGN